ncbi:MAG: hypothetical protein ABJB39_04940, partial [Chloroflexota bacterium]
MPCTYDDVVVRSFGLIAMVVIAASACAPAAALPTPSPTAPAASASAVPTATRPAGLVDRPTARADEAPRRWYTTPDGLFGDPVPVAIQFPGVDAAAGLPRARLASSGRVSDLVPDPTGGPRWVGAVELRGVPAGEQTVEYLVRLRDGTDALVATTRFMLSAPEYVVWTLDFEGDAASDAALANTAEIAKMFSIPMTLMWNPRVWTTTQVSAERADAMLAWTMKMRADTAAEVALHLHAWTDYVRLAGVTPRVSPSWASRGDGYDVPLTAFNEAETKQLIDLALKLMFAHGMPIPTSFRGGGLFANAANLRAVAAAGFTVDTSATPAGDFGQLALPWSLPRDAQPYRPSRDDANVPGDLPVLEVPNIAGNTYGYTAFSIQRTVNDDRAMLA